MENIGIKRKVSDKDSFVNEHINNKKGKSDTKDSIVQEQKLRRISKVKLKRRNGHLRLKVGTGTIAKRMLNTQCKPF